MDAKTIVVLEGDETGQELLEESLRVLAPDVVGVGLDLLRFDLSLERRRTTSNGIVYEAAAAIREHGLGLKAATVTPEQRGDVGSPNRILREQIGGKVIVRTGRRIPGVAPLGGVHAPISIVRMAVGDAYGAHEWREGEGDDEVAFRTERIESLAIPPAWRDVWISPRPYAKLQATGYDKAGRKQYLYHPDYRVAQEQAKFDRLIRFGERLPELREAMTAHLDRDELDRERVAAVALRLIGLGWFRAGSERHARDGTYGVSTLLKRHVRVRGRRIRLSFPSKAGSRVRSELVDEELAAAIRRLLKVKGGPRLFRYRSEGDLYNLTNRRLNDYVKMHLGEEFTAKDFRTWGGTLLASIYFAELVERHGFPESDRERKRSTTAVMRRVAKQLGNTPAVVRASYVSPAVVDQYLDGRTIDDFRPRHLRVVKARDPGLTPEEQAVLSLLRSWRIRSARKAA